MKASSASTRLARRMACAIAGIGLASVGALSAARAQTIAAPETAQQRNPACVRLEGQLANLNQGQGDNRADQIKRYEEAASKQQAELDRATAQARGMGCGGGGFFLFGGQPAQCDQLNGQIQRMRANLDTIRAGLQQLQGGGREEQRQAIMVALAQNNCGPQYRAAAAARPPRGLFDTLFGGPQESTVEGLPESPQSSSFRTVCQRMCPAAEVALYAYRNQGEDISKATSISGRAYTELPNAFRYRQEYNPSCTCKRPGESWAAAVGEDPTVERGDIVVTDDKAKELSQPKAEPPAKPARTEPAKPRTRTSASPPTGKPTPAGTEPANAPAATGSSGAAPPAALVSPSDKPRPVGPQFLPAR